jgi:hypothetical protein
MLTSVDSLVFEEIIVTSGLYGIDQFLIHRQRPERGQKFLSGEAERFFGEGVGCPKDNEAIGGISLPDLPVGEGVTDSSSLKIDMRSNHPFQTICSLLLFERSRTIGSSEITFHLNSQSFRVVVITLPSKSSLPDRSRLKALFGLSQSFLKSFAFQKQIFLQLLDDLLDLLRINNFTKSPHIGGLNIQDGMLAVKKGNDEINRRGQKEGGFTDVLGILKADQRLARHLDGKDIHVSKFREIHR